MWLKVIFVYICFRILRSKPPFHIEEYGIAITWLKIVNNTLSLLEIVSFQIQEHSIQNKRVNNTEQIDLNRFITYQSK